MEMIFDLVKNILEWAGASINAQEIVSSIFNWIMGIMPI